MEISIAYEELLYDVREHSHNEVKGIPDPEARYIAEAGSEKDELLKRCAIEAMARVKNICSRFVSDVVAEYADNNGETPFDWVVVMEGGERRFSGKAEGIAALMHSVAVNLVLSHFCATVGQGDLAKMHDQRATEIANDLTSMLYEKRPPYPLPRPNKIEE